MVNILPRALARYVKESTKPGAVPYTIWDGWADQDGGRAELVQGLKDNSDSCRQIVSAWNVSRAPGHGAAAGS
jgi:hypothetical protein